MAGRASAFAVLGLKPGADVAAIEHAYKRLIKQHHPDREGGDASKAAEINRAYRELRGGNAAADPLEFNDEMHWPRRRPWQFFVFVLALALLAAVVAIGPSVPRPDRLSAVADLVKGGGAAGAAAVTFDEGVHDEAIEAGVREALRLYRTKDEIALAAESRDCQHRFRERPGTALLDHCAAFDDAVVGLQDRDPLRDAGPFAPLAVTGRQWSAASMLSDDTLAIDGRLDRIRLEVEMILAAELAPPPAPSRPTQR